MQIGQNMKSRSDLFFPKITKVHLQNFQAISGPANIEIGDITILIGPNSVGKSAVREAISFFKSVLDADSSVETDLAIHARHFDRHEGDDTPLCSVGIEIEISPTVIGILNFEMEAYTGHLDTHMYTQVLRWLEKDMKTNDRCANIEMRLTFFTQAENPLSEKEVTYCKNSIGKIELFINRNTYPFLAIGEQDFDDFFDVIRKHLPDDYVELLSITDAETDPTDNVVQLKPDYENFNKLSGSLDWSARDPVSEILSLLNDAPRTDEKFEKPQMFFSQSKCLLDLDQDISSCLRPDQMRSSHTGVRNSIRSNYERNSLLDRYVLSASESTLIHRGVYWNPYGENRENRLSFECNPNALHRTEPDLEDHVSQKIYPDNSDIMLKASEQHVVSLGSFIEKFVDIFRSALHVSHVPADRPIINSNEPISLMDPLDWYSACFSKADTRLHWPHYSDHPGGVLPKFFESRALDHRPFYRGYEYALGEYAWHIARQEEPGIEEKETFDIHFDGSLYYDRGLPKPNIDFPNHSLRRLLPTLSRYEFRRECYKIEPHWLNPVDVNASSNLIYFRVYDNEQKRTFDFSELGSGISFVFPILVSLGEARLSFIEQPELHLHPRAQAEIADVLIAAQNANGLSIVETHSEQMIMRISDRIRYAYQKNRTEDVIDIDPEKGIAANRVKIHYFERGHYQNEGATITEITINKDGSLVDAWPNNFFAENDTSTLSRVKLFSGNLDLEDAQKRLPWVDRIADEDVRKWVLCAAESASIADMFPVVFPIYLQKIAERLIELQLFIPFMEKYQPGPSDVFSDKENGDKMFYEYLIRKGKGRPLALGQSVTVLNKTNVNYKVIEYKDKYLQAFRNFVMSLPKQDRTLWRDTRFLSRLNKLAKIRNKAAHTGSPDADTVKELRDLLIQDDQPGVLLRAFGI
jgi:predicted ATPase